MEKSKSDAVDEFLAELNSSFKEITDMMQVLGKDCDEQYSAILSNDNQMHRRAYVRSVFAFIEGSLYGMKRAAAHLGRTIGTLLIAELVIIDGVSFDVDDKGVVVPRPVFIKFLNNVKFSFRVYSQSVGSTFELSLGGVGWQNLRDAVKVRDRLMHPKATKDLEVTDAEVEATNNAFDWFLISYALCSHHAQKAARAKTSAAQDVATLDAKIQDLERKLKDIGS